LQSMLGHLNLSINEPNHHVANWLGLSGKENQIRKATEEFAVDLGMATEYSSLEGMIQWTIERVSLYQRMINERLEPRIQQDELPSSHFYREIGYLPLKLLRQLRVRGAISPLQRVLFILDEYDQCELAGRPEFAYSINSFVKTTARGSIPNVYVKIGTRPHGFHNNSVLGGQSKIEDGRDYNGIDLFSVLRKKRKVFSQLVVDIANRRIRNVEWFKDRGINDIQGLLESANPLEEAELYRSEKSDKEVHFKSMEGYCKHFPYRQSLYVEIKNLIIDAVSETLYQKYLVILVCRMLYRARKLSHSRFESFFQTVRDEIALVGAFLKSKGTSKINSKLYYKMKDIREPALFLLASDYRQPKYYCGLETIKLMCEGVPLNFIKLGRAIFDELRYRINEFERKKTVNVRWQNRAIRAVASEIRKELRANLCNGQNFLILLDELGFIFRKMQLTPTAPYPSSNGFSIEKEREWLVNSGIACCIDCEQEPLPILKRVLREATDWGYLIEITHRSKSGSLKTRTKYYISSMLAPYYDLSVRHLKEPYYVEVDDLLRLSSTDRSERANIRNILASGAQSINTNAIQLEMIGSSSPIPKETDKNVSG